MTSEDWAIVWYEAATMGEAGRLPVGSQDVSCREPFLPDGRMVAVREQRLRFRSGLGHVRVFPVAPDSSRRIARGPFSAHGIVLPVYHLEFSPDGSRLMASGDSMSGCGSHERGRTIPINPG